MGAALWKYDASRLSLYSTSKTMSRAGICIAFLRAQNVSKGPSKLQRYYEQEPDRYY